MAIPGKVSIQIPTYNQQQYISRAIESALMQNYPDLEIIVADDCSTDETAQIVKQFTDPRIKYFKNEKNIGRVANYRKALYDYCTGEWVVNLDGDDYYTNPSFISRGMRLINEYRERGNEVMFYQAVISVMDEKTAKETPKRHALLGDKEYDIFDNYYFGKFRKNQFFSHLTTIYHRATAMRIGFYEYNTLNTDFESMMKLSFYGKVILDNTPCGVWVLHDKNESAGSSTGFLQNNTSLFSRMEEYAKKAFGKDYEVYWRSKLKKENQIIHLEWLAENGNFSQLLRYMFKYKRIYKRTPLLLAKSIVR